MTKIPMTKTKLVYLSFFFDHLSIVIWIYLRLGSWILIFPFISVQAIVYAFNK